VIPDEATELEPEEVLSEPEDGLEVALEAVSDAEVEPELSLTEVEPELPLSEVEPELLLADVESEATVRVGVAVPVAVPVVRLAVPVVAALCAGSTVWMNTASPTVEAAAPDSAARRTLRRRSTAASRRLVALRRSAFRSAVALGELDLMVLSLASQREKSRNSS